MAAGRLSKEEIASYERDGFLSPIEVMSEADAACIRRGLEEVVASPAADPKTDFRQLHLVRQWAYELIHHPGLLDAVEDLIGPDLLLWRTNCFIKGPNTATFVSWHQDATYWRLEPPIGITAWLALSPVDSANGCVRAIPGSHKWGQIAHEDVESDVNLLSRGQTAKITIDESTAVDFVLRPGQISLHDLFVLHGSGPNQASYPRVGIGLIYLPPKVRQIGLRPGVVLVRGKDSYGNFSIDPAPPADLAPEAMEARSRSLAVQAAMLQPAKK